MTNSNHVVQSLSNTRFLGVCSWIDTSPHTFQIQWNVMLVIALWCNHMSLQIRQISSEDKRTPLSLSVVTNHFLFIKIFKSITMYVELRKSTKYPLIILTLSSCFRVSFSRSPPPRARSTSTSHKGSPYSPVRILLPLWRDISYEKLASYSWTERDLFCWDLGDMGCRHCLQDPYK